MSAIPWIAQRVILGFLRDPRTLALFFLVPLVVMSLVYVSLAHDEEARVAVLARGAARLFVGDLEDALAREDNITLEYLTAIPDDERDGPTLERMIREELRSGHVDGVLYFPEALIADRFSGKAGQLQLFLEGSRPTVTATVASAVASAADDLASALPVVIDAQCSAACANSVNVKPLDIDKRYLYGSEDLRQIDFFLPVLLPFFVFFLTFLLANVTFQRERVRGTLERLLIAPVRLAEVIVGYVFGFILFALVQAAIVLAFLLALLDFPVTAVQMAGLVLITLMMVVIALLLGLLVSFAARNEFQAIQFVPLVVLPQVFFGDLIWSIDALPSSLRWIAYLMPLTHANIATRNVLLKGQSLWESWPQLLVLVGMGLLVLLLLTVVGRRVGEG